jgi:hypothetical protein
MTISNGFRGSTKLLPYGTSRLPAPEQLFGLMLMS